MRQKVFLALIPLLLVVAFSLPSRTHAQAGDPAPISATPSPASEPFSELVPTARKNAPLGLTASDGTGLRLVELEAQAVVEGPLAFTELRLTFENPQDRVLEGRFQITLPDKAAISRFAMKIDDQWQEAEVVERQAARAAYEDFLHRRQDPALLENAAGNEFSARIFPIAAKGRKELILSYSQELRGPYRLPLQGLPRIGRLELSTKISKSPGGTSLTPEIQAIRRENFLPEGDFVVAGAPQPQALRAGDLLVASVRPHHNLGTVAATPLDDLVILVDTSASRALGQADQAELVTDLLKELPKLQKVTLAAFDQEVKLLYSGPPGRFPSKALLERQSLGATDLNAALRWAAQQKGHSRLLVVTDGVSTAGSEQLKSALKGGSLKRVDVLLMGGIRDKERMDTLVTDGLPQDGLVLEAQGGAADIAGKLSLGVISGVDVSVEDALWVWPTTLDSLQPGDQRLVYAQLKSPQSEIKLALGGQPVPLEISPCAVAPLLQRQATVARVARLESLWKDAPEEDKTSLAAEIVKLSTTYRVLSDKTALLVLETEQDYARFNIDRKALADILVVGDNGLEVKARDIVVAGPKQPPDLSERGGETAEDRPSDGSVGADLDDSMAGSPNQMESQTPPGSPPNPITAPEPVRLPAQVSGTAVASPTAPAAPRPSAREPRRREDSRSETPRDSEEMLTQDSVAEKKGSAPSLSGPMAEIKSLLMAGKNDEALAKARTWQTKDPGNVLALVALGECLEAKGLKAEAARAYGSIIDLFPARADLRRFAGSRLESLGASGLSLAVDTFEKAVEQRPDHVSSHRYLALALARQGNYEAAFKTLERGLAQDYPGGRFLSYERILGDDLGIMGAAWAAKDPDQKPAIVARLAKRGGKIATEPSLRFVLTWETDANDVDFHIHDAKEGHAYYSSPTLPSGGELYGDVTTGYGPECFAITGKARAFPYRLQIHYYSRGPMGYGMGQLEILQHDGLGHLLFEERPYIVVEDGAYVDLGIVEQSLQARR
jgi:Flp pilus assembly protein TadD